MGLLANRPTVVMFSSIKYYTLLASGICWHLPISGSFRETDRLPAILKKLATGISKGAFNWPNFWQINATCTLYCLADDVWMVLATLQQFWYYYGIVDRSVRLRQFQTTDYKTRHLYALETGKGRRDLRSSQPNHWVITMSDAWLTHCHHIFQSPVISHTRLHASDTDSSWRTYSQCEIHESPELSMTSVKSIAVRARFLNESSFI